MAETRYARRRTVSATEAAKTFGRLVDRVREDMATYTVERGGVPVARIGPAGPARAVIRDFKALLADSGRLGEEYARAVDTVVRRHTRPRIRRNPWAR